jgi:hypothetical protein
VFGLAPFGLGRVGCVFLGLDGVAFPMGWAKVQPFILAALSEWDDVFQIPAFAGRDLAAADVALAVPLLENGDTLAG